MNRIRISTLLAYFCSTLAEYVDECYAIKYEYTEGKVSYKRAYRALDLLMKRAWQRLRLCENLNEMLGFADPEVYELRQDLMSLTEWMSD